MSSVDNISRAESFYNRLTELTEQIESKAVDSEVVTKEGVSYETWTFEDGSKLTLGNNGYLSAETVA